MDADHSVDDSGGDCFVAGLLRDSFGGEEEGGSPQGVGPVWSLPDKMPNQSRAWTPVPAFVWFQRVGQLLPSEPATTCRALNDVDHSPRELTATGPRGGGCPKRASLCEFHPVPRLKWFGRHRHTK